jgi:hypothetical protein
MCIKIIAFFKQDKQLSRDRFMLCLIHAMLISHQGIMHPKFKTPLLKIKIKTIIRTQD